MLISNEWTPNNFSRTGEGKYIEEVIMDTVLKKIL